MQIDCHRVKNNPRTGKRTGKQTGKPTFMKPLSRYLSILTLGLFLQIGITTQNLYSQEKIMEEALFAGGCFWCVEHLFDTVKGVVSTTSGYTGGHVDNPTYEQVSNGHTGHTEAVRVVFDPTIVSYSELLKHFWVNIDPTTPNRQFCDTGNQYRAALFFHNQEQQHQAETSKAILEKTKPFSEVIATEISPATPFFPAETYHQNYHHKNPIRYKLYRLGCGRDQRLKMLWQQYDASQLTKGLQP